MSEKIDINKVKEDLKRLEERRFEKRAERLKELRENSLFILGYFQSKASIYLDEAPNCHINGNFRACIFACSVSADQILRHKMIKQSKNKSKAHKKIRELLLERCRLDAVISMPSEVFKPYAGVSTDILFFIKGESTNEVWFYDMQADGFSLDDK